MKISQRQVGSIVCLDVEGRLVTGMEDALKNQVNRLFVEGHRAILLNLGNVSQIDTSGLTAFIAVRGTAEKYGGTISLLHLPRRVHDLLVVTKLITLFNVFDSERDALCRLSHADV